MATKTVKILGGIDNGNGYVKAALKGGDGEVDRFDLPSGAAVVTQPADLPASDAAAPEEVGEDFYNKIDISFDTPLVSNTHRHLLGTRGLRANASLFKEFDIVGGGSKAEQELSMVFVIGLFAAKGVKDYVLSSGGLPEEMLKVSARVALALPIDEFRQHRTRFAAALKSTEHVVVLRNFETPVYVKVVFDHVAVTAEGGSAQYAIQKSGVELTRAMMVDLKSQGYELPEGVTADDVHAAENTVAIDIGEGTVNFPVYQAGSLNVDVSRTFTEGYGHVLTNALPKLAQDKALAHPTRKSLADYLVSEPGPLKRADWERTRQIVETEAELWCEQLVAQFSRVLSDIRHTTEVGYVFGGGSGPLKDILYPKLLSAVGTSFPVLYLDAKYSRHLNRAGLLIAAENIAAAEKKR